MNAPLPPQVLRQHLIDPEICIRCNTCEETCPLHAITHDARNYVVDAQVCNGCMACIAPCPTGAIDNWRLVARESAHSCAAQLQWDVLPGDAWHEGAPGAAASEGMGDAACAPGVSAVPEATTAWATTTTSPVTAASAATTATATAATSFAAAQGGEVGESPASRAVSDRSPGATLPPASASHPYVNLYTARAPLVATVTGNFRVTDSDTESDTHHIVLDFGATPLPVLEGQSIGIVPPGVDALGRAHFPRQYSIASPRDGERPGYNNVALTVKRVSVDHDGQPVRGVCSSFLCELAKGDAVQVVGPFGNTFLMPNDPDAHLLMICTGTGAAPMRAMTERRRRGRDHGTPQGRLMLFFGARTERELPYFGPLSSLPTDFIDINLAYSRTPGASKRYVQHAMRERAADVAALLADPLTCIYVCGLKGMEGGVLDALRDIAMAQGHDWPALYTRLKGEGRLHFETY